MWLQRCISIVIAIALTLSVSSSNQLNLHLHLCNKTLSVQILTSPMDDMSCKCQVGLTNPPNFREDYVYAPGLGAYKLHTTAKTWNEARKVCREENARLAVVNSKTEEAVLLDLLKKHSSLIRNGVNKEQAYVGVHDMFAEGEWLTIDSESLYTTGYTEWSSNWYGAQPDNKDGDQNCGALVVSGGLNDAHCADKLAFLCESYDARSCTSKLGSEPVA